MWTELSKLKSKTNPKKLKSDKKEEKKPNKTTELKKRKLDDTDIQVSNIVTADDKQVPHAPNLKKRKIEQELKQKVKERKQIMNNKDTEEAATQYRESKLESALTKAEHGRDNTDEKVLKSKLKQKASKAKKSAKEWAEREQQVKDDKEKRAEKKDENRKNKKLRGKKDFQKPGKDEEVKKKRPGFEGRGKVINGIKKVQKTASKLKQGGKKA